jgi:hypothetical protein
VGLLVPLTGKAQFLDYGTDPARWKWNQIKLEHYTLIYPRGLDSLACRYALYLESVRPHLMKTLGEPVKASFPVVLHPGNMLSNGMVAWSPRRMELLTTPSFTQQAESWERHLVIHESRHVVQTGKLMRGFFRPLYYLMGEQAAGLASAFVPRWFFEGDAVGTETALTKAGRGRLPEFQMVYRAQMLSGSFYSFDKWFLGSYKDYTGDFYALGYDLTSFARYRYGADIWDKTTSRYAKRPIAFPPFSRAFKHHTGIGFSQLFRETFDFLRTEWESRDTGYLTPRYLTPETRQYTSYRYPQAWNDSTVVGVKTSLSDLPALVSVTHGREQRLAYLGSQHSPLTRHGDRLYWTEVMPGLRWTHENHTVVRYYDLAGRRAGTLTPRRRYFAPAAGDSTLAVSLFTEAGENRIALLSPANGQEQALHAVPGNAFVKEMVWGRGDTLFALAVGSEGISLLSLDVGTGQWDEWLKPTTANIASLTYADGKLYFESGLDGINNIYCLDASRKAYRLTAARFGAFQPAWSADGKRLLYADYQATGYRFASLAADSLARVEADFAHPAPFTLAETLARQEDFVLGDSALPAAAFRPRPYRKAAHLLRVHSWAPVHYSVSELMNGSASDFTTAIRPGATLISQNALNTAIAQGGWYYDYVNDRHHGTLDLLYMGWFPVVHLNADYGGKAFDVIWEKNDKGETQLLTRNAGRTLFEARMQVYLPLNLTTGHYVRGIQPSVNYYLTNNRYQQSGSRRMSNFQYLLSELRFYSYRKMAQRDILPRWGYQARLQYLSMPFNAANYSALYAARLTTYWPGILPHHSLMLRAGYQYQPDKGNPLYIPRQLLEGARGYDYQYRTRQQAAFKADYAFPLACPDFRLGSVIYLRRLRANLFYDATLNQADAQSGWTSQSAYGGDLLFEWNALRFAFPLTTGVRITQPLSGGQTRAEGIFSISF